MPATRIASGATGVCESGAYTVNAGVLGSRGTAGHFFHLDIADVHHQRQRAIQLGLALRRQRNVVRVAADRAVVVIRRHRVERLSFRRESPEAAA